jgi:DNA-binding CsgD family transcriptional regulator/tetratricopeptide (TPR) repeat protein
MLVGRDAERHLLDALLAGARLGQSGVLIVTGEAGIGKTALLDQVRASAEDIQVLSVTGTEPERDLPFAGLAQLLRLTKTDLAHLPPPQAEALGVALALSPGDAADRFAVGAGLLTLLTQRSEVAPLCLIIDDAHQLDPPSQEALLFVARRLLADAIAVIVAFREGEPCRLAGAGLPQLTLTGIGREATGALVRAELGEPGSRLVDQVIALSLGNPLAVRELIADPGALTASPAEFPRPLSVSLGQVYARRATELDPDALTAARCAAVAGHELAVVARTCDDLGVDVAALERAEAMGLLNVRADEVRFRHPLVRSALYATATPADRRRLHAAAARAVDDRDDDRRAWHLSEAVLGPDEPTAAAMERVGRRAADRAAYAVAASGAERAATLSPTAPERARRLLAAGTWAWLGGSTEDARRLLDRAAELAQSADVRARTQHQLGVIAARSGSVEQARDILLRAAGTATEPADALASLAEAVDVCFLLGDATTAVTVAREIERLLPAADDAAARARGSIAAGCARILAGEDGHGQIQDGLDRLRSAAAGDREPTLAGWEVIGRLFLRDSRSARDQLTAAVSDRRNRSAVGELPHLLFHLARDSAASDRWDRAGADYGEAVTLARELGQTTELTAAVAGLAWLEARRGRVAASTAYAAEALELAERHQVHVMEIWARLAQADLAYGLGNVATALDHYQRVAARLDELGLRDVDLSPAPEIVECRLRLDRTARVDDLATEYARRAEVKGQPWARARAARTTALLSSDVDLDPAFTRALVLHDATVDGYERARTLLAYGARLRRARRRIDARAVLQPALDTFVRLGAQPWADATADELAATGAAVSRPDHNPTVRLTPRELQIAMLLTEGRTTRETASALFVSPKTVEYHLRNIYTKLDIGSRTELAERLDRS